MGWPEELAAELHKRDNKTGFQPQIGQVVSVSPLRIALLSDNVILERGQIYLCSALAENQSRNCKAELQTVNETGTLTFENVLTPGDLVACIPTAQTPKFIVIDKVVTA